MVRSEMKIKYNNRKLNRQSITVSASNLVGQHSTALKS